MNFDADERYIIVEYRGRWWVKDTLTRQMSSPRATQSEAQARLENLLKFGSVMGKAARKDEAK